MPDAPEHASHKRSSRAVWAEQAVMQDHALEDQIREDGFCALGKADWFVLHAGTPHATITSAPTTPTRAIAMVSKLSQR